MPDRSEPITQLLQQWRSGNREALGRLTPIVYDELRRLARRSMKGERAGHTLQPTALVHEAYVRLAGAEIDWRNRAHFFAVAARLMRRILVDHARGSHRARRGGGLERVTLTDALGVGGGREDLDLVALDEALRRLAAQDERKAAIVELHFFGGLDYDELAETVGVSAATVDRDLRLAKAWLRKEMRPTSGSSAR